MTKLFISYAHSDETYRQELEKHLSVLKRKRLIDTWTDREIRPGENWGNKIAKELEEANVVLLLISADFLASNYCYDIEMTRAIERHANHEAIVIPIILRYCDWVNTPFATIQTLPVNGKPVKDWNDQDQAFLDIVEGLKALLNSLNNNDQQVNFLLVPSNPKLILSDIRKKILTASNSRDFDEARFELEQYTKIHPISFEVRELEKLIESGLSYENKTVRTMSHREYPVEKRSPFTIRLIFLVIIAIIIIILLYFLFFK